MVPDPEHVLHVEDSDEDAALIAHLLRGLPFRISRARTYGEMLDHAGPADIVLLDLRIPGSDNPIRLVSDAVRRFRTAGIILLTGISDTEGEEISVRAMAAGAQVRLIKGTFDRRRLHLAIREAYQQRQHMIRTIEESRSDMRIDPASLQDSLRQVLGVEFAERLRKLESHSNQIVGKLRKLGAEDTQPISITPDRYRLMSRVWHMAKDHQKFLGWLGAILVSGYFAARSYITDTRDAIFDTRRRVILIEKSLDIEESDGTE